MYTALIILIVIAALLMIFIVYIQESKGGGLSSGFASYNQIGGVRKTTDWIEKTTWGLAIAMVVLSILCTWVAKSTKESSSVMERITNESTMPEGFETGDQVEDQASPDATMPQLPTQPAQ